MIRHAAALLLSMPLIGCRAEVPASPVPAAPVPSPRPDANAPTAITTAALALAPAPPPAPKSGTRIRVAYTSNVRGQFDRWARPAHRLGGIARRTALVATLRRESPNLIHVEAGDSLLPPAGQLAYLDGDPDERLRRVDFVLGVSAQAGVQAIVPGRADLAVGAATLAQHARRAQAHVVCANLADDAGKPVFDADRIITVGGVAVGIFGVMDSGPGESFPAEAGATITDAVSASRTAIASLRSRGARAVVALFHTQAFDRAAALAAAASGIDLLVVGGTGQVTATPYFSNGARIVEAGLDGKRVGVLDLFATDAGITPGEHRLHDLERAVGEDRTFASITEKYARDLRVRVATGKLALVDLRQANRDPPPARKGETPHAMLKEIWTYGSSEACALCHGKESEQWKTTSHAFAFESLMSKKRETDPECLPCHSTAFLRPGGTRSLVTATTYFANVGCESCHGPSVPHLRARNKSGTLLRVSEVTCRGCHADERGGEDWHYPDDMRAVLGPGHGS